MLVPWRVVVFFSPSTVSSLFVPPMQHPFDSQPSQVKSILTAMGGHNAIYISSQPTAAISTMQLGYSKLIQIGT